MIEVEIVEEDVSYCELNGMDVRKIVDFEQNFNDFVTIIEQTVNSYIKFWSELELESPDIEKLQSLGSNITHLVPTVKNSFQKLSKTNSTNDK